ncbi:MAG TPA: GYD family protein [Deltaproteobacteria bacterium]|nr:MAG: GYD family protein [Deltaproteobacteria bacterium GWC2_65_14]HBO69818.1 GYD family protein [Deltaproteobacteria bacterium]
MPTYVSLINWTDQGIRNVKQSTERAKAFKDMAEKLKVKVREIHWTMGRYDVVVVVDAPDDRAISRLMLGLGILGNARTETLRAYSSQEMSLILEGIPQGSAG